MVRILTGADAGVTSPLIMPTDAELRQLAKIVYAKYPQLDTSRELAKDHDLAFRQTFWAVGWLGRLPAVEPKNPHHITWWMGYLTDLLSSHRIDLEVTGQIFGAVCLAHGDIPHTITERWPLDVVFGLTYPHAWAPASAAWRHVLKTGALRSSSPVAQRDYQPGQVINLAPNAPIGLVR
jgi:hypothetical protein